MQEDKVSPFKQMTRGLYLGARALLDMVLPPRCLKCGTEVATPGSLCATCWGQLRFIAAPHCARCGLPFDYDPAGGDQTDLVCGACIARPPPFDRARSVLAYEEASRPLLLGLKHGDRTDSVPGLAAWLARAGAPLWQEADIIAAVPLHRWRLLRRRYNQSAMLALALGKQTGRTVLPALLRRHRATPSQGGLTAKGRARNVAGAFDIHPALRDRVRGARILLIDDVFTTGATVGECARVLRRGGARAVDVLTLARVIRPVAMEAVDQDPAG